MAPRALEGRSLRRAAGLPGLSRPTVSHTSYGVSRDPDTDSAARFAPRSGTISNQQPTRVGEPMVPRV